MDSNNKGAAGSQLLSNIMMSHLSNVKNSLYLFDETHCSSKAFRNLLINYNIDQLLNSKIYGTVILVSFRNPSKELSLLSTDIQAKFSYQALQQNPLKINDIEYLSKLSHGGQSIPKKESLTVYKVDNFIVINAFPILQQTKSITAYHMLRQSEKSCETLLKIIEKIVAQLGLQQVGVVIDRLEILKLLAKQSEVLNFMKSIQNGKGYEKIFPFYVHSDFSLIKDQLFQLQIQKQCNGYVRVEKENQAQTKGQQQAVHYALMYASAVKSGNRFIDEVSVIQYSLESSDIKLLGNKVDAMRYFEDPSRKGGNQDEKQKAVKSSFKIEINDEDKKVRDKQQTTVYHTGPQIQLEEEDLKEIEKRKLEDIEEGEADEDEDEDDGDEDDDPDEDLNF